ncbi:homoserine dehydrogenase [Methanobacterium paludis]|uniref:Homoserine dehydrogenase n=1 Tax=Methanobacterium paludis (strain DSM 25820 / JCM 18151 / SWAN1) TaxID=868131 RepID=F6D3H3_METPW|nr:homoserine dehydrogenase [Methanobacterium paludis]AEG19149.1 homoserine dehydrogenase [Methanobacterium paludis]
MKDNVNIGLIGFGTIGSGVVETFNQNFDLINDKVKKDVKLKRVVDLDITTDRGVKVDPEVLSTDVNDILEDPEIDIVIELMGGYQPALKFILKALNNGKHVVTANKALLAKHWEEIIAAARENNVRICFEASVGGGIPLLQPLNESLAANNVKEIYGIINGTANYILTKMTEEGREFEDVLKEAQEKGYAEADPTFDIEGHDTAQKLIILTILGFGIYVKQERFHVEGITKVTPDDILFAKEELGCCIKLLAISKLVDGELEVRVHPTIVPEDHLLSSVNGVFNGAYLVGDIVGPVMMYGQGAGMMPTASAVVGDCIDIIQNMTKPVAYGPEKSKVKTVKAMEDVRSKYYLRLTTIDQPGVLHTISGILSDYSISLESVNQKQTAKGEPVPIFMVTHGALEKHMTAAVERINKLDFVRGETVFIRLL